MVEHDIVDYTNLNRQGYTIDDVGKYKAHANLLRAALFATRPMVISGYAMTIQEFAKKYGSKRKYHCLAFGFDNDEANVAGAHLALSMQSPAVFYNVSADAENCRIFIQRPGEACFACYKPEALTNPYEGRCPAAAISDILHVAVGFTLRAVICELLGQRISDYYNCRDISFMGMDFKQMIQRNPDCELCSERKEIWE